MSIEFSDIIARIVRVPSANDRNLSPFLANLPAVPERHERACSSD